MTPHGAGIPDATVSTIDPTTGAVVKEVETDVNGYFSASVPPGTYDVESSKTGTVDNTKTVSVGAGEVVSTTLMNPWLTDEEAKGEARLEKVAQRRLNLGLKSGAGKIHLPVHIRKFRFVIKVTGF